MSSRHGRTSLPNRRSSRFLLDVNALLALLDPRHVFHDQAHEWLATHAAPRLLTCSVVENGVLRVASQPKYPNCFGTAADVRRILKRFIKDPRHEFCREDTTLLDDNVLVDPSMLTPLRVTDLYLLALATVNQARLATFDVKIPAKAIRNGRSALALIPRGI